MDTDRISASESRLRRRARQYIASDLMPAAQVTLESLLLRQPQDASARMDLASVMLKQGQMRAATQQLLQAVPSLPDDAELITKLAGRLNNLGEILAARACLDRAGRARNASAQLLAEQSHLRWTLGEIPLAMELMEQAIAAGFDTPGAYYLRALMHLVFGDMNRAGEELDKCLRRWSNFGDAMVLLVNLRKQTPKSNHIDALQRELRSIPGDSPDPRHRLVRAEFESALFKEFDDLGRVGEAWPALARSNALMHALNPYDAASEAAVTDTIIGACASIGVADSKSLVKFEGPTPIFIVGMPRSGTTLLDRMLSSHSQVVSAGEINDFLHQLQWVADVPPRGEQGMLAALQRTADIDFAQLGARYLQQTQWRAQGHRYYIDKLPINVRMVPFIRRALPHAPILHMVREPMDVCYSNFKAMFGNTSAYSYDMQALAHYYRQYARLTDHWRTAMLGAMLDVSYTSLVRDPQAGLRLVLEHCGLAMEEGCLRPERNAAPVATPSSAQVREPIHTRNLGAWQRYAAQLEPLRLAIHERSSGVPGYNS